jgi:broad specificity phosphatase PhoE
LTTLYLVRHGQTDWNVAGRYQGQLDPPLNHQGRQQAREMAVALADVGFDAIYSSDLARARQTAAALAALIGCPVQLDARLREIHQGQWQGRLIADIRQEWPDVLTRWERAPWQNSPPAGERLEQVQARLFAAIDEIVAHHPDETVAVFTHKLPIALLRIRHQGQPPERLWSLLPQNCAWEVFQLHPHSTPSNEGLNPLKLP